MKKEYRFMQLQGGAIIFVVRFTKDHKRVIAYNLNSNSLKFAIYERKNIAKQTIPTETGIDIFTRTMYDRTASDRKEEVRLLLNKIGLKLS